MRTKSVPFPFAVSVIYITFAYRKMKKKLFHVLALSAIGLTHNTMQAQETMFIHTGGHCMAHHMKNIAAINVSADTIRLETDAVYPSADIDSITFTDLRCEAVRAGWWGNLYDGLATCYYEQHEANRPDMEVLSADGVCTAAHYFPYDQQASARGPHKVGGKWRYIRGTLSGQHKVQYCFLDDQPDGGYPRVTLPDGSEAIDLGSLLSALPTPTVRRAVNYWYHPEISDDMPDMPVFGNNFTANVQGQQIIIRNDLSLADNAVTVTTEPYMLFTGNGYMVGGDSMIISFDTPEKARQQYELMEKPDDESISISLGYCDIIVFEWFDAVTVDEYNRMLIEFNLDMARPVFIRDDE